MRQHKNAALTIAQRIEIKRLYQQENKAVNQLALTYQVSEATIRKWIKRESPFDLPSTAHRLPGVITELYRQAVLAYRKDHPHHGPIRIAHQLKEDYPFANRGTVLKILQEKQLTTAKKAKKPENHLAVGRHRVQMDVQQLPCIEGESGFEYKISIIHLATRFKYSEIHPEATTENIAQVFQRALDALPPFLGSGPIML
jgi:transposase